MSVLENNPIGIPNLCNRMSSEAEFEIGQRGFKSSHGQRFNGRAWQSRLKYPETSPTNMQSDTVITKL
jgi:hypothetical protein